MTTAPEGMPAARRIDPDRFLPLAADVDVGNGRHLLLDDPDGRHRLWFVEHSQGHGHAFLIPFDDDFGARLHGLQRFYRRLLGRRSGAPPRSLQLTQAQRAELALLLRAHDADSEGTSRREMAAVLLDPAARDIPAIEWKTAALRKRINRALTNSAALVNGGYLKLLRGDPERARRFRR